MIENISETEAVVMRHVRRIRALRFIINGVTAAGLLLVLALWGIGREVWVAKVFSNGPQDLLGRWGYLAYALLHTRFIVQALSLLALASLIALARSAAHAASSLFFTSTRTA